MANGTIAASQLEMLSQAGTGITTIVPPATNTNRTINLPDSNGTILTTATAGVPVNGPAFSAYASSNQTLSNATWTKINYGAEEFDTNGNFASSRFTPSVAGYYQVTGSCNFAASSTNTRFVSVYKNGSIFKNLQNLPANSTNYMLLSGSCLIYLNGSTDYVEIYAQQNSGGNLDTSGSDTQVYFQAAMVRGA